MGIDRRYFFEKVMAIGAGVAVLARGIKAVAAGLPSDIDAKRPAAAGPDEILLPAFEKNGTFTLEQALLQRRTERSFDKDAALPAEALSRILWAANGVNRPDGHRTTPSAVASYPVDIYAALPEGVFLYDLKAHKLVKVLSEDIRGEIPIQPGLKKAGLKLLYVINEKKIVGGETGWADLEIGCMVQDVYLMAAQLELGCTVFAIVHYDKITEKLALKKDQKLRIAQAVGALRA